MADGFRLSLGGLEVACDGLGDTATLALRGELDSVSVPVLRQALDRCFAGGASSLRLELAELSFIDSSGLGALVGAWRTCQSAEGTATALNPSPGVREVMDVTGVSRFLLPSP